VIFKTYILLHLIFFSWQVLASKYCAIDQHTFYCFDQASGISQQFRIHPIEVEGQRKRLVDGGVIITNQSQLLALSSESQLSAFINPFEVPACHNERTETNQVQKVFYKPQEFNETLAPNDGTLERINELLDVMHEADICSLSVIQDPYLNINDIDDVVEQFICISNFESSFGRGIDNFGKGGRGAWGIHPTEHDTEGGACADLSPIARHSDGREVTKEQNPNVYSSKEMRTENFKCAINLYNRTGRNAGFRAWGQRLSDAPWGSNRHCLPNLRDDYKFRELIGSKMCCTEQCKQELNQSI
jgi:hypothetical protein